jgi:hypothetical protein
VKRSKIPRLISLRSPFCELTVHRQRVEPGSTVGDLALSNGRWLRRSGETGVRCSGLSIALSWRLKRLTVVPLGSHSAIHR